MSKKKTVFDTFEKIAYKDWVGTGEFESYECGFCGEDIDFPKRKCHECGATYTFERATLQLIRPVMIKDGEVKPTPEYILKWREELNAVAESKRSKPLIDKIKGFFKR